MKKMLLVFAIVFGFTFSLFAQFSVSSNFGHSINIPKNEFVAQSTCPFLGFYFNYKFKNYFIRSGLQNYSLLTNNGGQVYQYTIPLSFGVSVRKNNIEQMLGLGYSLGLPSKFLNTSKESYTTHSLNSFIETRFYSTEKTFFTLGMNVNYDLKTSSSVVDLYRSSALYFGFGVKLGKK